MGGSPVKSGKNGSHSPCHWCRLRFALFRQRCLCRSEDHPSAYPSARTNRTPVTSADTTLLQELLIASLSSPPTQSPPVRTAIHISDITRALNSRRSSFLTVVKTRIHRRRHSTCASARGGMIHRCIDISWYFSRDTYRDIIFYNLNFFFFLIIFFFFPQWFSFRQKRDIIIYTCNFCKVIPQIHSYFVKIICEISVETN